MPTLDVNFDLFFDIVNYFSAKNCVICSRFPQKL